MLPDKIQLIIFEVRNKEKNTVDFKNAVVEYLEDMYELNGIQAAMCYKKAAFEHTEFENIYYKSQVWAEFAYFVLKNN